MIFRRSSAKERQRPTAISELLTHAGVEVAMHPGSRDEWIASLVDLLVRCHHLPKRDEILRAVMEREDTLPTAIGNAVAIPHAKTDAVPGLVLACGVAPDGVEFRAADGKPVKIAFLLVSPRTEQGQHVQALAAISRIMIRDGAMDRLLASISGRDFLRVMKEEEEEL